MQVVGLRAGVTSLVLLIMFYYVGKNTLSMDRTSMSQIQEANINNSQEKAAKNIKACNGGKKSDVLLDPGRVIAWTCKRESDTIHLLTGFPDKIAMRRLKGCINHDSVFNMETDVSGALSWKCSRTPHTVHHILN